MTRPLPSANRTPTSTPNVQIPPDLADSVPEAAALLSISQEYLYRLIQTGGFPAVRMRLRGNQGRYVVPAEAIERLLSDAASISGCLEIGESRHRALVGGDEVQR